MTPSSMVLRNPRALQESRESCTAAGGCRPAPPLLVMAGSTAYDPPVPDLLRLSHMPPPFKAIGPLIRLPRLDASAAGALHTVAFRFPDDPQEKWTRRFTRFKQGEREAVASGSAVMAHALRSFSRRTEKPVVVVGAISSSDEELAVDSPVRRMGEAVEEATGWEWVPDLLSKSAHPPLHTLASATERDRAVSECYRSEAAGGPPGIFLILDDLCTRGATFAEVRRALVAANPGWTYVNVALGKNEKREFWSGDISNDHVPPALEQAWQGT